MRSSAEPNPYASPQAEEQPPELADVDDLKDDRLIVLPPKCDLPPRCLFCNHPATAQRRLRYSWWLYFWGVFSISILWFVCATHELQVRRKRRSELLGSMFFVAVVAFFQVVDLIPGANRGWLSTQSYLLLSGLVLVAWVWGWMRRHEAWRNLTMPKVVRAEHDAVALKHAGKPFLDSLADGREGFLVVDKVP